jgi:hypothetical protein
LAGVAGWDDEAVNARNNVVEESEGSVRDSVGVPAVLDEDEEDDALLEMAADELKYSYTVIPLTSIIITHPKH